MDTRDWGENSNNWVRPVQNLEARGASRACGRKFGDSRDWAHQWKLGRQVETPET